MTSEIIYKIRKASNKMIILGWLNLFFNVRAMFVNTKSYDTWRKIIMKIRSTYLSFSSHLLLSPYFFLNFCHLNEIFLKKKKPLSQLWSVAHVPLFPIMKYYCHSDITFESHANFGHTHTVTITNFRLLPHMWYFRNTIFFLPHLY